MLIKFSPYFDLTNKIIAVYSIYRLNFLSTQKRPGFKKHISARTGFGTCRPCWADIQPPRDVRDRGAALFYYTPCRDDCP